MKSCICRYPPYSKKQKAFVVWRCTDQKELCELPSYACLSESRAIGYNIIGTKKTDAGKILLQLQFNQSAAFQGTGGAYRNGI
jgi:hypothetical protein